MPSPIYTTSDLQLYVDNDLMDSIEQTSTDPQTVVYKINPKAVWSDGTGGQLQGLLPAVVGRPPPRPRPRGGRRQPAPSFDPASTTGYDQMKAPVCSDNGATVTTTYTTPYADWKSMFSGNAPMYPAHVIEKDLRCRGRHHDQGRTTPR